MNTTNTKQKLVQDEELQAAEKAVQALTAAYKSYALYPEEHVFCRTHLEKFTTHLAEFIGQYQEFSLVVERNTFLYEGEKILDGPPEETNLAYLLTRDGIVRLVFLQGIEPSEIASLLRLFNQHRSAGDDSGGDIVTSLWQAEFQHIEYEEVDIFALEKFNFDLGSLKAAPDDTPLNEVGEMGDHQEKQGKTLAETAGVDVEREQTQSPVQSETVTNLLRMEQTMKVLELTPVEKSILQSYVEEEEQKDYSNDVIDVLLIILISQKKSLHFTQVLEFVESVFFDTLNKGDFHLAYKLCSNVLTIRNQLKTIRPWAQELVDNFISSLSAAANWEEISWVKNPHLLADEYKEHQKFLWQVFRLLDPEIMFTIGPLMGNIGMDNIDVRNELFEIIESRAKKNPDKLNALLSSSDENVNLLLFPIVEGLGNLDAANISLQMSRHDSVEVRRTGLNGYIMFTQSPNCEDLFPLLNDEDKVIVGKLLPFLLSQVEKKEVEAMLLRFLKQAVSEGIEHAHMFEFYKALSQCGSITSVRVLEKILLESKVKEMFSNMNAVHKKGSALALKIIGSEEALRVLAKGKKSMRPDIRMACLFALDRIK